MTVGAVATDEAIWAVGSLAQINRMPFDKGLLMQGFPPPYRFDLLPQALLSLGFKCKSHKQLPAIAKLAKQFKLPCLMELRAHATDKTPSLALVIKTDSEGLWLFHPGDTEPRKLLLRDLASSTTGNWIACEPQTKAVDDPDTQGGQAFGFKWFIPVLLKHKGIWRDVLTASLVIQLIALATPLFTQVIIDKVVTHQTASTLAVIAAGLVIFMIFNAALTWVRQYLVLHTGNRVDAQLGSAVFEHLFRLPLRYFEHRPTGVIAARLHAVETIREFVASSLVTLLLDLPFLLIFVGIMFWYSVPLTLMVLAILAVITLISIIVAPLFRERLNHQFMLGARNQAFVTEYIASLETVKSLQMEPQLARRYRGYLATYLEAGFHTKQIGNTYNVVAGMLEQLMTMLVLCGGAWIVMKGSLTGAATDNAEPFTIGMLVAFQMFSGKLSQPMMRLVGLWQQFQQANISVKRLADIMNAPPEPYATAPSRETKRLGLVEIMDLGFRYAQDRPFLYESLNITLKPGTTTMLVGPSGSGKSTLAKLLQGFYVPTAGQIRIDGTDIRHLAANELRAYFGVVPQETNLFSGSIYDNLVMANPLATFEQVVQACKMAEINTVIEALPNGYQTEIGERGAGLSGGQKQRLAIARALLKRPQILIFDEATSALDAETAEHFAKTINALRGKVSMLFITHQQPKGLLVDEVVELGKK
jgi:ATP-binding cassette, subfamily B, bacterial HlyB/CyaB